MRFYSLVFILFFGIQIRSNAQSVPSYIPQQGLIGWWPFNDNALDESGNGNDFSVFGAQMTIDRFGNNNAAYKFNGFSDYLEQSFFASNQNLTISLWVKMDALPFSSFGAEFFGNGFGSSNGFGLKTTQTSVNLIAYGASFNVTNMQFEMPVNSWKHFLVRKSGSTFSIYIDGEINSYGSINLINASGFFSVGAIKPSSNLNYTNFFNGSVDDIGFWNRALSEEEITKIYRSCQMNVLNQPQSISIDNGGTAKFFVKTNINNPIFRWQSDIGFGFQNLNNAGQYQGVNTDTLIVSNVAQTNNNQLFRCIVSFEGCLDTTTTATLTVLPVNNKSMVSEKTISVYPNPATDFVIVETFEHKTQYCLVNNVGQKIITGELKNVSKIDLTNLQPGFYYLKIGDLSRRIVKISH